MKFVAIALMVIFALVAQTFAAAIAEEEGVCKGENEVWNGCGSGCGEQTCAQRLAGTFHHVMCPAVCRPGCYCTRGFIRLGKNTRGIDEKVCMPLNMCH